MISQQLIDDLSADIVAMDDSLRKEFIPLDEELLNKQPAPKKWSATQCFEHMNIALRIYVANIEATLKECERKGIKPKDEFKPVFNGKMGVAMFKPKPNNQINWKMPTFKGWNPGVDAPDNPRALEDLLDLHEKLLNQLERARNYDLTGPIVKSELWFIRFRLGDAFRFIIGHDQRHMLQAKRAVGLL